MTLFRLHRYRQDILENYSNERHAIAQQLIEYDKIVTALMNGEIPERYAGSKEDPLIIMDRFLAEIKNFTTGLSIHVSLASSHRQSNHLTSYLSTRRTY